MGLTFLLPYGVAFWILWRHGAWLRKQPLDRFSRAVVVGIQAALLVAIALNFLGPMLRGYPSFYFWMLMGVQEAIYLDVRSGRYGIVSPPAPSPEPIQHKT
jgi:hypothetical protein